MNERESLLVGRNRSPLAVGDPRHGTDNGYRNLGCRCAECRAAHTKAWRESSHRTGRHRPMAVYLADISSVREDTLKCCHCQEWKPDDAFPRRTSKPFRRGRHEWCTACQTAHQRQRRSRLSEAERERIRAYDRDRKRRVRSVET